MALNSQNIDYETNTILGSELHSTNINYQDYLRPTEVPEEPDYSPYISNVSIFFKFKISDKLSNKFLGLLMSL